MTKENENQLYIDALLCFPLPQLKEQIQHMVFL